jgi:hypothetical protein|tara:strand:- start:66 stop:989 length:924 start_codon:yes stop_codon:yes gene_type:complete
VVTIDVTHYCGAARNCWDVEILACKIAQHTDEKIILDLKHEGWDIVENGIEQKVKNICDELNIPYTQIEFTSSDRLCKSKTFKHTINSEYETFFSKLFNKVEIVSSTAFNYGLFCGRATNERLYSFWKHKNWQYSNRGKASMHLDISTISEWDSEFTSFICEYNENWQNLIPVLPYSDIDSYIKPPIIFGNSYDTDMWKRVYSELTIEIVVETTQTPDTFFITEKTFRPIAYGKLFLVIGSPLFEQNLKRMGFDIFDDIIDKSYDSESSYIRVDTVFKSLGRLLRNPIDMNTLLPRLEANKRVLETL